MNGHTHSPEQWAAVLSVAFVVYGAGAAAVVHTMEWTAETVKAIPGDTWALVKRAWEVAGIEAAALAFWAQVALSKARTLSREVVSVPAPLVAAAPKAVGR